MIYPAPKSVYVDVDGTLVRNGVLNFTLVAELKTRKAAGYELVLWSMRGREHAQQAANHFEVSFLFDAILSKPGILVDDRGIEWLRHVQIVIA